MTDTVKKFNDMIMFAMDNVLTPSMSVSIFKKIAQTYLMANQTFIITNIGPFLYRFRKQIDEGNFGHFVQWDYKEQMEDWRKYTAGYGESIVTGLRDTIKESIETVSKKKPKLLENIAKGLLSSYAQYVMEERSAARAANNSDPDPP